MLTLDSQGMTLRTREVRQLISQAKSDYGVNNRERLL